MNFYSNVVDHHFVETDGTEGALDNVGDGHDSRHILISNLLAASALTIDGETEVTLVGNHLWLTPARRCNS